MWRLLLRLFHTEKKLWVSMILAWVIMSDYELLFAIAPLFVCTFHLVVGANGKPSSWLPTCFAHIEAPSCLHRLYLWPRLDALDPIDTLFANASCLLYFNGWHSSQQHCQDKFLLLLRNIAIVSGHCSKWIGEEWIVYRATSYYPAHCGAKLHRSRSHTEYGLQAQGPLLK